MSFPSSLASQENTTQEAVEENQDRSNSIKQEQ